MSRWAEALNIVEDRAAETEGFREDVLDGLRRSPRRLPCKYLYDQRGSELFARICQLPEYYPTRTELALMRQHGDEMGALLGRHCRLVEYGSGEGIKTRILLENLREPAAYVPIDISREQLLHSAAALSLEYPRLQVLPLCGDYTQELSLPSSPRPAARTVVYFPGSTIGNFDPPQARRFLQHTRELGGSGGGLLIGVDLKKDPRILHAAYNDAAGVTAAFNLNLLERINRELGGRFILDRFAHYAFYNATRGRIEMHLVSLQSQAVLVADELVEFQRGQNIVTEHSYKYTVEEFQQLAIPCGYRPQRTWIDDRQFFSVMYFEAA